MSVNLKCLTCSAVLVDHKTFTPGGLVKESGKWCPVCKVFKVLDKVEATPDEESETDVEEIPHGTEQLRDDMNAVIGRYSDLTVCETLGVLFLLQLEIIERLKNCDHPDAQKK